RPARRRAAGREVRRDLLLHPQLDDGAPLRLDVAQALRRLVEALGVLAGVVVDLQLAAAARLEGRRLADLPRLPRRLEVVVAHAVLAGRQLAGDLPRRDARLAAVVGQELRPRLAGAGLVRRGRVGQDERVLALFVLEKVEDPLLLHHARDEV